MATLYYLILFNFSATSTHSFTGLFTTAALRVQVSTLIYTVSETLYENIKQIKKTKENKPTHNLFFKTFIKKSNIFHSIKLWTNKNLGKAYDVVLLQLANYAYRVK